MKRYLFTAAMLLSAVIFFTPCAFADVIQFTFSQYEAGTGFGNVENVLTLQATPQEAGSVAPGVKRDILAGDAKNTSKTWTSGQLKALGYNASNLGIVFNINEPGMTGANTVNLESFRLDFYYPNNNFFNSAFLVGFPIDGLAPIGGNGTGTAGYLMTYKQEGQNQNFLDWFFDDDTRILGATGKVSDSSSGPENFYLAKVSAVSEPFTLMLLGLGLVGLAGVRRFKK